MDVVIIPMDFNLFLQSGFSFNGSLIHLERFIPRCKREGFSTIALTDEAVLHGAVKFTELCQKYQIKPIIGLKIAIIGKTTSQTPLLLYAKNETGYTNLVQISSLIQTQKVMFDLEKLSTFQTGLIAVALVHNGDFYEAAKAQDMDLTIGLLNQYQEALADFYIGIDHSDFEIESQISPWYLEMDCSIICNHVMMESSQDITSAIALQSILKETTQTNDNLFANEMKNASFLTKEELNHRYLNCDKAIANTIKMIEKCQWTMSFTGRHLPKYPLEKSGDAQTFLSELARKGLKRRYVQKDQPTIPFEVYSNRLEFELDVIFKMGYEDYFLIVWDFVLYAKRNQILVGPGRGSAAGSLVSYVLGIVDVDPLEHGLFFERFLNPERITMPDIDMDFPDDRRDEVIQYVVNKYGMNHVMNIVAFGTFQGKSAIRDVGKYLGISELILSEISEMVNRQDNSLTAFFENDPQKVQMLRSNPEIDQLLSIASKIVDLPKHLGTHAAGIIITDEPIDSFVPIQIGLLGMYQSQFEASDLEKIGYNKIDFLGIRNLKTIQKVIELVKNKTGKEIDIYKIPMNDGPTFALLKQVHSLGIFQLESDGMMNLMRRMQLSTFDDISLCIALFRPGPMENIPTYLKRRFHQEEVQYIHPVLENILSSTKGIIVYQEQIMQIARDFAGYTLGEADVLRRAVSKKSDQILQAQRSVFVSKSLKLGHPEHLSNELYDYIVKFANYGFNKSHSVSYALVAYWMSYLKANYPTAFMAVLMDSVAGSATATKDYLKECRRLNIQVLPPKINVSGIHYQLEDRNLRFPYLGIRSIGATLAARLEEIQSQGKITSFLDFIKRSTDINQRALEALIMAGVFDEFGQTKQTLMANIKPVKSFVELNPHAAESEFLYQVYPEYDFAYLQATEKELLGVHLTYHAIQPYLMMASEQHWLLPSDVLTSQAGTGLLLGYLAKLRTIQTKSKESMAFLEMEDEFQTIDVVVFPKVYQQMKQHLQVGNIYVIQGSFETRQQKQQMICEKITKLGDS